METNQRKLIERIRELEFYAQNGRKKPTRRLRNTTRRRLPRQKPLDTGDIEEREQGNLSSEYKRDLIQFNESYYFKPAQFGVKVAKDSIREWHKQNYEEAIIRMKSAYKQFNHKDILFNLGKMYFAQGEDFEEGLVHLLDYYLSSDKDDFYATELKSLLSLKESNGTYNGTVKGIDDLLDFYIDKEGLVYFENELEVFKAEIPLPLKLPISLDIERKDIEEIKLEDYNYLKELIYFSNYSEYEIVIEKEKFTEFLSDFYGTVLDLVEKQDDIVPLAAFEELKMNLFLYNTAKHHYVAGFDEPKEIVFPNDKSLISILKIKIPMRNRNEFFMLFRNFVKQNFITSISESELAELFREKEQEEARFLEASMLRAERQIEYDRLIEHGKEYAKLNCVLKNLENNIDSEFIIDTEDYNGFYKKYLSLFQDQFLDLIKNRGEVEDKCKEVGLIARINETVQNISNPTIKKIVTKELENIVEIIEDKPQLTLNPMRRTLEIVVKEICVKKDIKITYQQDGKVLTRSLTALYKDLETKVISDAIYSLINKGNTGSHYNHLEPFISVQTNEAKSLFRLLLTSISFLAIEFDL